MPENQFLLLQVRNPGDPIQDDEVKCFAKAIGCPVSRIRPHDLISTCPTKEMLGSVDAVLIGGSGDYSVVDGGDWFDDAMSFFRMLCDIGKPTFASCWGFQAVAKALGGRVVTDLNRAEIGTHEFQLSSEGESDSVFSALGQTFMAQIGHQDIVETLPDVATRLCSTATVSNQAFVLSGKPIYGTQFHPELELADLVHRLTVYPEYVHRITGLSMEEFLKSCSPTPGVADLLTRFVRTCIE